MKQMEIVLYHHRHGVDTWLAEPNCGLASCVEVVLENLDEVEPEEAAEILRLVVGGEHVKALIRWGHLKEEEFSIKSVPGTCATSYEEVETSAREKLSTIEDKLRADED